MDELPISQVDPDMKWLLMFDPKVDDVGRQKIRRWDVFPRLNEVVRLTGKRDAGRIAVNIVDKPGTVKPLGRHTAKAVRSPQ